MQCPRCGGVNCTIISETSTSGKDFSVGKGLCGYWILGPIGVLCGACGEEKKVKEEAAKELPNVAKELDEAAKEIDEAVDEVKEEFKGKEGE